MFASRISTRKQSGSFRCPGWAAHGSDGRDLRGDEVAAVGKTCGKRFIVVGADVVAVNGTRCWSLEILLAGFILVTGARHDVGGHSNSAKSNCKEKRCALSEFYRNLSWTVRETRRRIGLIQDRSATVSWCR